MALKSTRIDVVNSPTPLGTSDSGSSIIVRNKGTASIDLGGSDVVYGEGFELEPGESISLETDERIFAISFSDAVRVDILQTGIG